MIELYDFLNYIDHQTEVYIRFKGDKLAISLRYFIMKHPNNWGKYGVYLAKSDYNDLIVEIYRV